MARIRKIRDGDGDSVFALYADSRYRDDNGELAELFVVPGGDRVYFTIHTRSTCVAFSGRKILTKFARAILKAAKK